jgi:hypothetical protein
MKQHKRRTKTIELVKWLRANGERFTDWDISGGYTNLTITFKNEKLELAYIMLWDWADPDPTSNRT